MGLSASKRVKSSLCDSPEFDSACDSAYSHCLSVTQYAFPGVFPYQLNAASDNLYRTLTTHRPHLLVLNWVSSPPTRSQVDSALRVVTRHGPHEGSGSDDHTLGPAQFKEWALELFTDAVVSSARKAVICRVPIGVAGIAGVGVVTQSGKDLVGTAIGVYALGVASAIYMSLSG